MRRHGDRVRITSGRYEGHRGTVEENVYQKTVDYPEEWANGYHVMLDTEKLVTVQLDQMKVRPRPQRPVTFNYFPSGTQSRHQGHKPAGVWPRLLETACYQDGVHL
jgi:hypothetical protein